MLEKGTIDCVCGNHIVKNYAEAEIVTGLDDDIKRYVFTCSVSGHRYSELVPMAISLDGEEAISNPGFSVADAGDNNKKITSI